MKTQQPLPIEIWTSRLKNHESLIKPIADAFLKRREIGRKHPVHDFLFTYYNMSPSKLRQWVPSINETLVMTPELREEYPWLTDCWFNFNGKLLSVNKEKIRNNVMSLAQFVAQLCDNILKRTPRFGCFGLHEWAMVYKLPLEELRHKERPLRLQADDLARFVESQKICCTHYDAYRFFTKEAHPLNTLNPVLETRLQMEQSGCIHANMDLYKWSIKLWPWIGSDLLAKAFMLAFEARELDMRASPYDLTEDGYSPICIETEEGRKEYQLEQQLLTEHATVIRKELLAFCQNLTNSDCTESTLIPIKTQIQQETHV